MSSHTNLLISDAVNPFLFPDRDVVVRVLWCWHVPGRSWAQRNGLRPSRGVDAGRLPLWRKRSLTKLGLRMQRPRGW